MINQGVTTMICGNCGASLAPLAPRSTLKSIFKVPFTKRNIMLAPSQGENILKNAKRWTNTSGVNVTWITFEEYLKEISKRGIACNFATLVGYNTCRRVIAGDEIRDISYDEMKLLKKMLEDSLESGALGISIGLAYSHANFIKTNEIHRLFSILRNDRKICAIHLRDEGEELEKSLREAFDVAYKNDISVEVSHLKIPLQNTNIDNILNDFNKAKEKGVNVNFDFYPYKRAWTSLYTYLPKWAIWGGKEEMLKRLKDKGNCKRIISDLKKLPYNFQDFIVTYLNYNKSLIGRKIGSIASNEGKSVEEMIIELLLVSKGHLNCFSDDDFIKPENLEKQIKNSHSIVCSDGAAYNLDYRNEEQLIHPRCFGAFPKFLKDYIIDKKLINWEEAIKKITYMPAQKVGLNKRGLIEKDYFADLVLINPKKVESEANYDNPYRSPKGIDFVVVNGLAALEDGKQNNNLFGRVLKN
jgi:N-acyl-D-amino-acid deacylase